MTNSNGQKSKGKKSKPPDEKLPVVMLPGGTVRVSDAAHELGELLGKTGRYYARGAAIVRLVRGELGEPSLAIVAPAALASTFEQVAQLAKWGRDKEMECGFRAEKATCTEPAAKLIAAAESFFSALPRIKVVSPCAVLTERDGKLVTVTGYDRESGIFAGGRDVPDVAISEAIELILGLLSEFRFATPSDKSRAVAAIITPALVLGGLLRGRAAFDLGEADKSQSGKGFRNKITGQIYGATITTVTQKRGGVGSMQESFDTALVRGASFISFDNLRGKLDLPALESFLTEDKYQARIPFCPAVDIDPRRIVVQMTSNSAEITPDLANRSSCVRILKQPDGFRFREYPEGGLLDHVMAHRERLLGAVFAIIRSWWDAGRPQTDETRHDFRDWARKLDWIVQNVFELPPLIDGYQEAKTRMTTPSLTWLRVVALAVLDAGESEKWLRAYSLLDLIAPTDVEIPSITIGDDLEDDAIRGKALRAIGTRLGQCFRDTASVAIDGIQVRRQDMTDDEGRPRHEYWFSRLGAQEREDQPDDSADQERPPGKSPVSRTPPHFPAHAPAQKPDNPAVPAQLLIKEIREDIFHDNNNLQAHAGDAGPAGKKPDGKCSQPRDRSIDQGPTGDRSEINRNAPEQLDTAHRWVDTPEGTDAEWGMTPAAELSELPRPESQPIVDQQPDDDGLWREFTTSDGRQGIERPNAPPRLPDWPLTDKSACRRLIGSGFPPYRHPERELKCDRCGTVELETMPCRDGQWLDHRCPRCGIESAYRDADGRLQQFFIGRTVRLTPNQPEQQPHDP